EVLLIVVADHPDLRQVRDHEEFLAHADHLAEIRRTAGNYPGDRGRHDDVRYDLAGIVKGLDVRPAQPQEEEPLAGSLDLRGMAGMARRDLFELLATGSTHLDE